MAGDRQRADRAAGGRIRARRLACRAGATAWLAVVWVLLCGQLTPGTVAGGIVVGAGLSALPASSANLRLRPRPLLLLVELGRLVLEVSRSTATLAWAALTTGRATRSAVILVPVQTERDDLAVLAASWLTLTPGTLVVDIDVEERELYVHLLPAPRGGDHGVERVRRESAQVEQRLTEALGGGGST